MIDVVVGDEESIDIGHIPAMKGEPLLGLAPADPGIEKQLDATCLDVDAVPVAADWSEMTCMGALYWNSRGADPAWDRWQELDRIGASPSKKEKAMEL